MKKCQGYRVALLLFVMAWLPGTVFAGERSLDTSNLPSIGLPSQPDDSVSKAKDEQEKARLKNEKKAMAAELKTAKDEAARLKKEKAAAQQSVPSSTPSTVKAPGMNYVLEAKFIESTWLSVQVDKEKKKSAIYQPGDHMVWQAEKKISLFVGNAGSVVLTLNGKPVPSLGKSMESARVSFPAE